MDYTKALVYATKMHETTPPRKGTGLPYITHPIAVAKLLRDKGFGIDMQIMGLFHDLLEDTKATREKIIEYGNPEIYEAVVLMTKTDKDTAAYINKINKNMKASAVKIADRIHNLRDSIQHPDHKWKIRYFNESDRFHRKLAEIHYEVDGVMGQVFLVDFTNALIKLGKDIGLI